MVERGSIDYKLFAHGTDAGVYFVTRLKENADFGAYETRRQAPRGLVGSDQVGRLNFFVAGAWWRREMRMVTIWDERHQCLIRLLTNHLGLAASTIAAIYKERWQIEIFFKTPKQNLKIKTFVGCSPIDHMANALETARSNYAAEEALYRRPADAKPSPPGAVLTGAFVSSPLGKATLRAEGDRLVLELENTGAQLGLEPFDGDVFTVRLLPQGRFARSAQLLGDRPLGFAEFQVNDKGKRSTLSWSSEGQTYIFRRE